MTNTPAPEDIDDMRVETTQGYLSGLNDQIAQLKRENEALMAVARVAKKLNDGITSNLVMRSPHGEELREYMLDSRHDADDLDAALEALPPELQDRFDG